MKARVAVKFKPDVPDPVGRACVQQISRSGFSEIKDIRVGKFIEIELESADRDIIASRIEQMCAKMFANSLIEDVEIISVD